jgi:hypothetical protein
MKKILTIILILFIYSCTKDSTLPTPINIIVNNTTDTTPKERVIMNLEFHKKTTTFLNCSDCDMWTINEGNCVVKDYYLNGTDTMPLAINLNYPIFLEFTDDGFVSYSGCYSSVNPTNYEINGNSFLFENEVYTIVVNNSYRFEYYKEVNNSNTQIYYIYNKR